MPELEVVRLRTALTAIASPKGAYSRDSVTYRDNVIAWCQERARLALEGLPDDELEPEEV